MEKHALIKSNLFLFGSLSLVLAFFTAIPSISESIQIQRYQTGSCTILAKHLFQQTRAALVSPDSGISEEIPISFPDFQVLVQTVGGSSSQTHGYDFDLSGEIDTGYWDDQSSGQAIVEAYTVGRIYPCWYDPANPMQMVLTRQLAPLLLPQAVALFFVGEISILFAMLRFVFHSRRETWMKTAEGSR